MPVVLKVLLIIVTAIYMLLLIRTIKKKNLQISFSVFWIVSGVLLVLALAIPNLIEEISHRLGFVAPSNMIFCLTIFVAFYLIFKLTIKLAQENERNTLLIQEISMLKKRVKKIEDEREEKNGK